MMVDLYIYIILAFTTASLGVQLQQQQSDIDKVVENKSDKTIAGFLLGDVLGVSDKLIAKIDPLSVKVLDLAEAYVKDNYDLGFSEAEESAISESFGRTRTIFGGNPNQAFSSIQEKAGQFLGNIGSLIQSQQVKETVKDSIGSVSAWFNLRSRNRTTQLETGQATQQETGQTTKQPNILYQLLLNSMASMKKDLFPASDLNLEERNEIKDLLVRNLNNLPGLLGWLTPSKEWFDLPFVVPDPLIPLLLGVAINLLVLLLLPWFSVLVFVLGQMVSLNLGWIFISDIVIDTITELVGSLVKSALPLPPQRAILMRAFE